MLKNNVHRSSCLNDFYFSHQLPPPFFLVCSHIFLMMFLKFSICSPRVFPIVSHSVTFLSHMVCPKFSPSHQYRWVEREALNHHIEIFILGASKVLVMFSFPLSWWANQNGTLQRDLLLCIIPHPWTQKTLDCTLVFPIFAHHHFKIFLGENFHQNVKNKVKKEYSINIFPFFWIKLLNFPL